MGKRKVTILETAVDAVAEVAFFIEGKDFPAPLKSILIQSFNFLKNYLMNERFIARVVILRGKK